MSSQMITGKVIDLITKQPIPGVTVQVIDNSTQGEIGDANTDVNGQYDIYLETPIEPQTSFIQFIDGSGKYLPDTWGDAAVQPPDILMDPQNVKSPTPSWVYILGGLAILVLLAFVYKHFKK